MSGEGSEVSTLPQSGGLENEGERLLHDLVVSWLRPTGWKAQGG